jgi:hypothetical protein
MLSADDEREAVAEAAAHALADSRWPHLEGPLVAALGTGIGPVSVTVSYESSTADEGEEWYVRSQHMTLTVGLSGVVSLESHSNFADTVGASQSNEWRSLPGTPADMTGIGRWLERWYTAIGHTSGHAYRTERHVS